MSSLPLLHPTCCELTQPGHIGPSRTAVTGEMTIATAACSAVCDLSNYAVLFSAKLELVDFINPRRRIFILSSPIPALYFHYHISEWLILQNINIFMFSCQLFVTASAAFRLRACNHPRLLNSVSLSKMLSRSL